MGIVNRSVAAKIGSDLTRGRISQQAYDGAMHGLPGYEQTNIRADQFPTFMPTTAAIDLSTASSSEILGYVPTGFQIYGVGVYVKTAPDADSEVQFGDDDGNDDDLGKIIIPSSASDGDRLEFDVSDFVDSGDNNINGPMENDKGIVIKVATDGNATNSPAVYVTPIVVPK